MIRIAKQPLVLVTICVCLSLPSRAQENELKSLESELNARYIEAVQTAKITRPIEEVQNIKDSESKWRAYRDAECKAENGSSTKGADACLVRMTKERIAAVKTAYLKNAENSK